MSKPTIDTFIAPPCIDDIDILFEDDSVLIINKPSGLLSLSGKNPQNKDSVHFRLVQKYPTAKMVHRLDFGTSGIMLVALNKSANTSLTHQFQGRNINKSYTSILHGHVLETHGEIDRPIAKDKINFPLVKVCYETGKEALTKFQVLEHLTAPNRTRVRFTPQTGRTHQLRVHSQQFGHPIVGCDLYGLLHDDAQRLMLHATTIAFNHPEDGKRLEFECPQAF